MLRSAARVRFATLITSLLLAAPAVGFAEPPSVEPAAPPATASAAELQQAPDFAFASTPYGWRHLHDLCAEGPVLLVFGADESALAALQTQQSRWTALGIEPLAVRSNTDGQNWKTLDRLDLTYGLLSDPNSVIASSFGVTESASAGHCVWYLLDEHLRVRRQAIGVPTGNDLDAMAAILGGSSEVAASGATR